MGLSVNSVEQIHGTTEMCVSAAPVRMSHRVPRFSGRVRCRLRECSGTAYSVMPNKCPETRALGGARLVRTDGQRFGNCPASCGLLSDYRRSLGWIATNR